MGLILVEFLYIVIESTSFAVRCRRPQELEKKPNLIK